MSQAEIVQVWLDQLKGDDPENQRSWSQLVMAQSPEPTTQEILAQPEKDQTFDLTPLEAALYRHLLENHGEPTVLNPNTLDSLPNFTLVFVQALRRKYGFGARMHVLITDDGKIRYAE